MKARYRLGSRCAVCGAYAPLISRVPYRLIAIARAAIRNGARGRFFNVVDLVNKLEAETRASRQGRMADRGGSVHLNSPALLLSGASAGFMPLREAAG